MNEVHTCPVEIGTESPRERLKAYSADLPEHYAVENGRRHVVDVSSCVRRRTLAAIQRVGG